MQSRFFYIHAWNLFKIYRRVNILIADSLILIGTTWQGPSIYQRISIPVYTIYFLNENIKYLSIHPIKKIKTSHLKWILWINLQLTGRSLFLKPSSTFSRTSGLRKRDSGRESERKEERLSGIEIRSRHVNLSCGRPLNARRQPTKTHLCHLVRLILFSWVVSC